MSGLPQASHGIPGTDPTGNFLALLSTGIISRTWGFFLVVLSLIPDIDTCDGCGDTARLVLQAAAGRSHLCVPPPEGGETGIAETAQPI